MKLLDLIKMSISNLWRRKLRTILTILGVIIGTASIVVMISLGIGLNKSMIDSVEESGGLTTINVSSGGGDTMYYGGGVAVSMDASASGSGSNEPVYLTDEVIEQLKQLPHVTVCSPVLSTSVLAKQGAYESWLQIQGMDLEALDRMNLPLAEGTMPEPGSSELKFVFGNMVIQDFYNPKSNSGGYWQTGELPDVDLINQPLFLIFDTDAYYQSQDPQSGIAPPKKYIGQGVGMLEGGPEDWKQYSYSTYCDIEVLKTQLKKIFKGKVIPGQPTTSSGKPRKELVYNSAYVQIDEMDNVMDIQKQIQAMGLQAYSEVEWLEQAQKQYRSIQAVLGGIGAVSLFVAAIGIANTMMMSIYERTKEIGIIKVLGCNMNNIRTMFLMEAGFIGLIGGFLGNLLSLLISKIINYVVVAMQGADMAGTTSYIPPWLMLVSLVFAVLVGMLAGFFPALRAMKLSPLAAIRTE
ncbi:ABC transporter permease [Diplocloster agilis]|uniref:ABC transporter permease n=1 Tax=Diplocloster agilis TaxID=2850323 RepID=UPI0008228062|nr:ABC transporter permease [Suonthocola fibrivorans]MCU6733619.1 ABC transporter permease [Suonthocola fibrivorans]SCJ00285.1 Macrolide export ATP-binding/permease protein MacB [uncultured Clostridium sp.]